MGLVKKGYFRAKFGDKVAFLQQTFGLGWRKKWRFWESKLALSEKYFWKPWQVTSTNCSVSDPFKLSPGFGVRLARVFFCPIFRQVQTSISPGF